MLPLLKSIFKRLHDIELQVGWPRWLLSVVTHFVVVLVNAAPYLDIEDSPVDLIGPSIANAIDGETLLIEGLEVNLFGIDAMERDQVCQDMQGADYVCGRSAVMALQKLIEGNPVICLPLFNLGETRVLGTCEVILPGEKPPTAPEDFIGDEYRPNSLSRLMVEQRHALTIGYGPEIFAEEQRQAQILRAEAWAGSFEPPSHFRSKPR